MIAKLVGIVLIVWGTTMAALAIANLMFLVLGSGPWDALLGIGLRLLLSLGASYVGFVIYRQAQTKKEK